MPLSCCSSVGHRRQTPPVSPVVTVPSTRPLIALACHVVLLSSQPPHSRRTLGIPCPLKRFDVASLHLSFFWFWYFNCWRVLSDDLFFKYQPSLRHPPCVAMAPSDVPRYIQPLCTGLPFCLTAFLSTSKVSGRDVIFRDAGGQDISRVTRPSRGDS